MNQSINQTIYKCLQETALFSHSEHVMKFLELSKERVLALLLRSIDVITLFIFVAKDYQLVALEHRIPNCIQDKIVYGIPYVGHRIALQAIKESIASELNNGGGIHRRNRTHEGQCKIDSTLCSFDMFRTFSAMMVKKLKHASENDAEKNAFLPFGKPKVPVFIISLYFAYFKQGN